MNNWLFSIINNTFFFTWIGALCGHILSLYSLDFKGTKPFLEKIIPKKSETLYIRIDFLILPIIGALLAYILLEPTNIKASIFSGLSWSGTLSALLRKNKEEMAKKDKK